MLLLLTIALIAFWLLVAATLVIVRFIRRRRLKSQVSQHTDELLCHCGYPLDQLCVLRCPECGRVAGFDASGHDLGLDETQLRRAAEKRHERQQHAISAKLPVLDEFTEH